MSHHRPLHGKTYFLWGKFSSMCTTFSKFTFKVMGLRRAMIWHNYYVRASYHQKWMWINMYNCTCINAYIGKGKGARVSKTNASFILGDTIRRIALRFNSSLHAYIRASKRWRCRLKLADLIKMILFHLLDHIIYVRIVQHNICNNHFSGKYLLVFTFSIRRRRRRNSQTLFLYLIMYI